MSTTAIIREIIKLSLSEKLLVKQTLRTIKKEEKLSLEQAVSALYNDYITEKELTLFTNLDTETFYEAR